METRENGPDRVVQELRKKRIGDRQTMLVLQVGEDMLFFKSISVLALNPACCDSCPGLSAFHLRASDQFNRIHGCRSIDNRQPECKCIGDAVSALGSVKAIRDVFGLRRGWVWGPGGSRRVKKGVRHDVPPGCAHRTLKAFAGPYPAVPAIGPHPLARSFCPRKIGWFPGRRHG